MTYRYSSWLYKDTYNEACEKLAKRRGQVISKQEIGEMFGGLRYREEHDALNHAVAEKLLVKFSSASYLVPAHDAKQRDILTGGDLGYVDFEMESLAAQFKELVYTRVGAISYFPTMRFALGKDKTRDIVEGEGILLARSEVGDSVVILTREGIFKCPLVYDREDSIVPDLQDKTTSPLLWLQYSATALKALTLYVVIET